jgi:amidase
MLTSLQTNCLTETFFDEALERAKFLDEYMENEKKPIGPLHGVPISVKVSLLGLLSHTKY